MKRIIAFCIIVFSLFATACQATPENPIVVHKDLDRLVETAQGDSKEIDTKKQPEGETQSALATRLGVPEIYSINEVFHTGKLRIIGNPTIELPPVEKVPVVRVTHENFSQEMANVLFDALCGDTVMYQRMALPTKEDIEREIVLMKQQIAQYEGDESSQRAIQNQIKQFEEFQKIVPDQIIYQATGPEIKPQPVHNMHTGKKLGESIGVSIAENPSSYGGNAGKYFQIQNNLEGYEVIIDETEGGWTVFSPGSRGATFYFEDSRKPAVERYQIDMMDVTDGILPDALPVHLDYTPEDAARDAIAFWQSVGLEDVCVQKVQLVCEFDEETYEEIQQKEMDKTSLSTEDIPNQYIHKAVDVVYNLELTRSLDGIPVSSDGAYYARLEMNEFSRVWSYEKLRMMLAKDQLLSANWISPCKMTEVVTSDTKLLPFSGIDAIFRQMFRVVYADTLQYNAYGELLEMQFELENIRFSLRRVMEQDQVGFGLLVPVWDFYGKQTAIYDNGREDVINLHESLLLTINAIDGSIIDIDRGY